MQKDVPIVQTYADLKAAFPGESNQASVVATGDVSSAAAQDAIAELREQGAVSGRIFEPVQVRHSQDGRTAEITFGMPGEMGQASAERSLAYVRETLVPQTIGAVEGVEVSVGGETAMTKDFNDLMSARMPIVFERTNKRWPSWQRVRTRMTRHKYSTRSRCWPPRLRPTHRI